MLFKLEVLSNGKKKTIQYDNINTEFKDLETGETYFKESRIKNYKRIAETYDIDFSHIAVLYINLGLKCNFSCKYCHQNSIRDKTQVSLCTPEKATHFIELLKSHPEVKIDRIALWGGEPLVYWKGLKVLIPALRELYPNVRINFPTNGALLTPEIVKFLESYQVSFYVSYDGKITNRDESILDNKKVVDALRQLKKGVRIMSTQNRASVPIKVIQDEFNAIGLKLREAGAFTVARCSPYNRNQATEILIPKEKSRNLSAFYYDALHSEKDEKKIYHGLLERFDENLKLFFLGKSVDSLSACYCPNSYGRDVTIDCDGKIFNCMNIPVHQIGTLEDFKPFDASYIFNHHTKKQKCLNCPYVLCCKGGCPMVHDENSIEFKVNCDNLKVLAIPFFRTVIERLFGVYLKRIVRASDGKVFGEF